MAIAYVNRAENTVSATGVLTASTTAASHTTGNLLVVYAQGQILAGRTITITDTAGNTYLQVGGGAGAIMVGANVGRMYYAYNITGHASNVVTMTISAGPSNNNYVAISVRQFSGFSTVDPLTNYAFNESLVTTQTAITGGTLRLFGSEGLIFAGIHGGNSVGSFTAGSGYTLTQFAGTPGAFFADEYRIVTGTDTPSATSANTGVWYMVAAVFVANPSTGSGAGGFAFLG
jgi:hypothetical protein